MKTRKIFCANEQEETVHAVAIDSNGEFVLTCECGRFVKLPGDLGKDEISALLKLHAASNKGQVSQAAIDKDNEEKLKNI